jgi:hypothetical protein
VAPKARPDTLTGAHTSEREDDAEGCAGVRWWCGAKGSSWIPHRRAMLRESKMKLKAVLRILVCVAPLPRPDTPPACTGERERRMLKVRLYGGAVWRQRFVLDTQKNACLREKMTHVEGCAGAYQDVWLPVLIPLTGVSQREKKS